ncbi:hypothetical protein GCM10020216_034740 [Nonomuraea helvata]
MFGRLGADTVPADAGDAMAKARTMATTTAQLFLIFRDIAMTSLFGTYRRGWGGADAQ